MDDSDLDRSSGLPTLARVRGETFRPMSDDLRGLNRIGCNGSADERRSY
jgi:hypothetical protein